jgi:3-dehydroquinate synthase
LFESAEAFVFDAGEQHKTIETYSKAIQYLASAGIHRNHTIAAIGGGVTTDMGGFVAATYKRGIPCIYIPTSLMAMVDASIGGKTGVNHQHLKNYIGAFVEPREILICPDFLNTLPDREKLSGFAEVLKHGLIGDTSYWNQCINLNPLELSSNAWLSIIQQSANYKLKIVEEDPKENGLRKILNFGHTIGHAVESHLLKSGQHITHGEAVACGMICESFIAHRINGLSDSELSEITNGIRKHYSALKIRPDDIKSIGDLTLYDKKNDTNGVQMALLQHIGNCSTAIRVHTDLITEAVDYYISL